MPISDILGTIQTLEGIKHQQAMDQLQQQVADANIANARQAVLAALPQGDAREAFISQDWHKLSQALPQSADVLKNFITSDAVRTGQINPAEVGYRTLTGMSQGEAAMSGATAEGLQNVPSIFGKGASDFQHAFLLHLIGQTPEGYAVGQQIAGSPERAQQAANIQAGLGVSMGDQMKLNLQRQIEETDTKIKMMDLRSRERLGMDENRTREYQALLEYRASLAHAQAQAAGKNTGMTPSEYINLLQGGLSTMKELSGKPVDPASQQALLNLYNAFAGASGGAMKPLPTGEDQSKPGDLSSFQKFLLSITKSR